MGRTLFGGGGGGREGRKGTAKFFLFIKIEKRGGK